MRICFVGESFVNGTGDPQCLGWTGRICAAAHQQGYEITYYNLGIRRETSHELLQRWQAEVTRRLPPEYDGRIVFSLGVNDTTWENGKTRVDWQQSIENIRLILKVAQQQWLTLMVGPPPIEDPEQNQRIYDLSEQFSLVCAAFNIPYLDVFNPLQKSEIWKQEVAANDGAHPRALGYSELAHLVQEWSGWQSWF